MPPLRLAVFDCDGTLVDSQHSIVDAMFEACDRHGYARPTALAVTRVVGLPLVDAVVRLVPDLEPGQGEELCETYKAAFGQMRQEGSVREPLFPGVLDTLDELESRGWLLGIATGKAFRGLKATLGHHGILDRFITHQTADRARGKPHPEMMLNAIEQTGVDPANAIMIGDTTFDVEMAVSAGTRAIGVGWGYHEHHELIDAGALTVVDSGPALTAALLDAVETD